MSICFLLGKSHSGDDTPEINGINHTSNDYNGGWYFLLLYSFLK